MFTGVDYVSFETAKLLKEKGFDEPCERFYSKMYDSIQDTFSLRFKNVTYKKLEEGDILIPTLYKAQMWLLEKHSLFVEITAVALRGSDSPCGFSTNIFYGGESDWELCDCLNDVSSYRQALNAGIRKALKMI